MNNTYASTHECCGTCKYNKADFGDFFCGKEDCENYGLSTMYDDLCEEWEER